MKSRTARPHLWAAALLIGAAGAAYAHGDVTPQAVDTKGLPELGETWRAENPYRKNEAAVKIGSSAFNQNWARCHGLEAISGGIAPDLRTQLFRAIDGLSDKLRPVYVMHDVEGYTHEEIARELGITPGGSKSQLFKARAKLRRLLAHVVDGLTPDTDPENVAPVF